MKTDKKLLVAIIVLIALVMWLVVLSLRRDVDNTQLSQRLTRIETMQKELANPPKPVDGKTPILGVDYFNGKSIKGDSAYTVAVKNGFKGTEQDWLLSLKQEGPKGDVGPAGESAYQIAVRHGFFGTEKEWLESLKAPAGDTGPRGASIDITCLNGLLSKKLTTDSFWKLTNIKCEVGSE